MRRIIRLLPGGQMASRATAGCRQGTCVIVVDVASGTGRRYVGAREREIGLSVVVKICRRPRSRVVAACAIGKRKSRPGRLMRRIIRLLPGGQMASRATAGCRQGTGVIVIDMAGGAGRIYVSAREREIRIRVVVELGVQPSIKGMAIRAIRSGKMRVSRSGRNMWWIGGALIVLRVTGDAFGGKPHKNSRGCVLMALRAFHNSVRA